MRKLHPYRVRDIYKCIVNLKEELTVYIKNDEFYIYNSYHNETYVIDKDDLWKITDGVKREVFVR